MGKGRYARGLSEIHCISSDEKKPGSTFFTSALEKNCTNIDPKMEKERPPEGVGKEAYAFDNPHFKDDEADAARAKTQDAAEKGESGFEADNGNVQNSHENKVNVFPKQKRNRPFSNMQFPNIFHQGFKKPRALDDTFIAKPLERVEVPLRGHDFTGLGFNICGNMRDGIFVKDVLHRGPASESGKIKAGDKILGVWVSFSGMVYEDALTILSYASPYDVRLELEKTVDPGKSLALPASSPTNKARQVSSSFRTGQRLFHPLYRSQSFDDLTQIGKDNNLPLKNNASAVTGANPNSCSSCPKRSQSIEGATAPKPRIQAECIAKPSRKPSTSSSESAKNASPGPKKEISKVESAMAQPLKIKSPKMFPSPGKAVMEKQAAERYSPQQKFNNTSAQEAKSDLSDLYTNETASEEVLSNGETATVIEEDRPTAPPRKVPAHSKRKAPAPPRESSETKTSAIVHRDADEEDIPQEHTIDEYTRTENHGESKDAHSLSGDPPSQQHSKDVHPESSPKRKACSLGDLTKLDSGQKRHSPATTTILERAVSLDLQQSLPEGNLVKQKMILKTPTFEDPEDSSEDLVPKGEEKKLCTGLTRWEGNWLGRQEDKSITETEAIDTILSSTSVDINIDGTIANGHSYQHKESEDQKSHFICKPLSDLIINNKLDLRATSTPAKLCNESEYFKESVDIDDIPYLGDITANSSTEVAEPTISDRSGEICAAASQISLSIPVIRPNFSQYEVLPSPGKTSSANPSPISTQISPNDEQRHGTLGQDIGSIESAYKPVFSSNVFRDSNTNLDETVLSALDIVNGNGLDISTSSYAQYRTALEDSSVSDTCVLESKSTKDAKTRSSPEVTEIRVQGGAAGFAKTLIICTPIEGESISLNADLDTTLPTLEPPL